MVKVIRFHCRCNRKACQARKTLRKHPGDYKYPRKCKAIGCSGIMRLDGYRHKGLKDKRIRELDRGKTCCDWQCDLHYPHRRNSEGCFYKSEFER